MNSVTKLIVADTQDGILDTIILEKMELEIGQFLVGSECRSLLAPQISNLKLLAPLLEPQKAIAAFAYSTYNPNGKRSFYSTIILI